MFSWISGLMTGSSPVVSDEPGNFFSCEVYLLEGSEWVKQSEGGLETDKDSQSFKTEIVDRKKKLEIPMAGLLTAHRFIDHEDGKTCIQFISDRNEWGLKFPDSVTADRFARAAASLISKQASRMIYEFGISSSVTLLEFGDGGWEEISKVGIVIGKRLSDNESFLILSGNTNSILFRSAITAGLNFEFKFPRVTFLGTEMFESGVRFLALNFLNHNDYESFKSVLASIIRKPLKSSLSEDQPNPTGTRNSTVADKGGWQPGTPPSKTRRNFQVFSDSENSELSEASENDWGQVLSDEDSESEIPGNSLTSKMNKLLAVSRKDRCIVVQKNVEKSGNRKSYAGGSAGFTGLRLLREKRGGLKDAGEIAKNVKHQDGSAVVAPKSALLHNQESQIFLVDAGITNSILSVDLETGKVVNEWKGPTGGVTEISSRLKESEDACIWAINHKSVSLMDPRIANRPEVMNYTYIRPVNLSTVNVDNKGHLALGSKTGQIRLFDGEASPSIPGNLKKTKSLLEGFGDPIDAIDITKDGHWMVATCSSYLVLLGLSIPEPGNCYENIPEEPKTRAAKVKAAAMPTGFTKSLSGNPSQTTHLTLSSADVLKFGLKSVQFTAARFDETENIIVATVGHLAVAFDVSHAKKGRCVYSVKPMRSEILSSNVLHGNVIAMYQQGVEVATRNNKA